MKHFGLLIIICLMVSGLFARSIWQDRNLYNPNANLRIGDIIVVSVEDTSNLNFSVSFDNDNSFTISSNPDKSLTGFLPKISSDRTTTTGNKNQFQSRGSASLEIAATITRRAGRNYVITGVRSYIFQGLRNQIQVTGIVSPALIHGNKIKSNRIANFTMQISGTRQGIINLKRDPLKKDEKANVKLTETEKQRIIIEYLQKMLRELLQ